MGTAAHQGSATLVVVMQYAAMHAGHSTRAAKVTAVPGICSTRLLRAHMARPLARSHAGGEQAGLQEAVADPDGGNPAGPAVPRRHRRGRDGLRQDSGVRAAHADIHHEAAGDDRGAGGRGAVRCHHGAHARAGVADRGGAAQGFCRSRKSEGVPRSRSRACRYMWVPA